MPPTHTVFKILRVLTGMGYPSFELFLGLGSGLGFANWVIELEAPPPDVEVRSYSVTTHRKV